MLSVSEVTRASHTPRRDPVWASRLSRQMCSKVSTRSW